MLPDSGLAVCADGAYGLSDAGATRAAIASFARWLQRKSPGSSTCRHYANDLALFFAWADKPASDIGVRDVDAYITHCQERGHAVATINRRLAALRAFYAFLSLDLDNAPANPVVPRRHFIRHGVRLPRDVEDDTLARLFAVVTRPRDRAMFLLMLRCGLRVGEVRALRLRDLYLQPQAGSLPRLWLRGKGGAERVVYLSPQALEALRDWLAERPAVDHDAVFVSRFGVSPSVTAIQRLLGRHCAKAGVWITCHQFRHTLGRHLAEQHVPVTSIQRLFGHARLKTTEAYIHISDTVVMTDYAGAMEDVTRRLPLPALMPPQLPPCPPDSRVHAREGG